MIKNPIKIEDIKNVRKTIKENGDGQKYPWENYHFGAKSKKNRN